ncbi:hypothetical protein EAH72_14530 [Pseudomonas caspiana]|uniref:Uncharacterized protein n=1 Tax=Pseudomonas mandelii TaxID=75612 RepID=A0A502I4E2_9PSED|nr:hypothetical protein EAH74_21755 [Pseudomonas mandelii]TPG95292.1 hypothetical protein EAH72_14530 [Pseudomonas caspiana]
MKANPIPMWERACSRIRSDIQHLSRLTYCYREQARSHRFCIDLNVIRRGRPTPVPDALQQ